MSEAELLTFADYSLHFGNGASLPSNPNPNPNPNPDPDPDPNLPLTP